MGAADADGLPAAEGADAVGNEAVCAPVTTANDVARPGGSGAESGTARRNLGTRSQFLTKLGHVPRFRLRKEGLQISAENKFRATFGGAVGVVAAHRIIFSVAPDPFPVFIAFVAGDVDQDFDAGGFANGLKHIDRAADIGVKGQFRLVVGKADEGLGGQVKDKFRLMFLESLHEMIEITDIPMNMGDFILKPGGLEIVGLAGRSKGIADDIRPQFLQPDRQPGTFESGVAGD